MQPLVLVLTPPFVPASAGLLERAQTAWSNPLWAGTTTAILALCFAAPQVLRRLSVLAVRAYERLRWIEERALVDDEYAWTRSLVHGALVRYPSYHGPAKPPFLDPPYDTKPAARDATVEKRIEPKPAPAEEGEGTAAPKPTAPPSAPGPSPVPAYAIADLFAQQASPAGAPRVAYVDVGRLPVAIARDYAGRISAFVAELTSRPEAEVLKLIRLAPGEETIHRLFREWTSPRALLSKTAGFARDFELAPILAIIVDKPVRDVERRLEAAPKSQALTTVFMPELARKLLGRDISKRGEAIGQRR
jgi:hypothetical protein